MKTAYFNAAGEALMVVDSASMAAPESAVFAAEVENHMSPNDIYFDDGVHLKTDLDLTDSRNELAGIPPSSRVLFDGQMAVVDDGTYEIDTAVEDEMTVYIEHPRFIPAHIIMETGP